MFIKTNFKYAIVDHSIRKNSAIEAQNLKKKLSKLKINLKIIKNKRKLNLIFRVMPGKLDTIYYLHTVKKIRSLIL